MNKRLKPRELTPEEQEEKEIQEEIYLETHGMTREEYEREQLEIIKDLQECEREAERQELLKELTRQGDDEG